MGGGVYHLITFIPSLSSPKPSQLPFSPSNPWPLFSLMVTAWIYGHTCIFLNVTHSVRIMLPVCMLPGLNLGHCNDWLALPLGRSLLRTSAFLGCYTVLCVGLRPCGVFPSGVRQVHRCHPSSAHVWAGILVGPSDITTRCSHSSLPDPLALSIFLFHFCMSPESWGTVQLLSETVMEAMRNHFKGG